MSVAAVRVFWTRADAPDMLLTGQRVEYVVNGGTPVIIPQGVDADQAVIDVPLPGVVTFSVIAFDAQGNWLRGPGYTFTLPADVGRDTPIPPNGLGYQVLTIRP